MYKILINDLSRSGYTNSFVEHWLDNYNDSSIASLKMQMKLLKIRPVSLPHGAAGWSAVCDCGISRTYSLTF